MNLGPFQPNTYVVGDCRELLRDLPDESINCCVTSPPYWGLRDYGEQGQLGLEATPEEYVANMVEVFREVRRALRDDGTLWLNLGDSYANTKVGNTNGTGAGGVSTGKVQQKEGVLDQQFVKQLPPGLKPKDLVGIPWRVAFALQADGWYLRSDIIWAKPNPMPESVQGSHWSRHPVTLAEYERLSRLWQERGGERDWPGDMPKMPPREILGGEAALSAQREGTEDGASKRGARGRKGKTPSVRPVSSRAEEQSQVRGDAEGAIEQEKGASQVLVNREGSQESGGISSANERLPIEDRTEKAGECALSPQPKGESEEAKGLCQAQGGGRPVSPGNRGGLDRHTSETQESLLLLPKTEGVDVGSRHPAEQRRTAREGEHCASLPELQFNEEGQDCAPGLIECPGCHVCEGNGGYVWKLSAGRPTKSHEYLFLMAKSERYYYDAEAVAEPALNTPGGRLSGQTKHATDWPKGSAAEGHGLDRGGTRDKRNRRSVWTIPTEPTPDAHFATFPRKLVEPCILAGCPAGGITLDIFGGSGTVGRVAEDLGRKWLLFDLSAKYAEIAKRKTAQTGILGRCV